MTPSHILLCNCVVVFHRGLGYGHRLRGQGDHAQRARARSATPARKLVFVEEDDVDTAGLALLALARCA